MSYERFGKKKEKKEGIVVSLDGGYSGESIFSNKKKDQRTWLGKV